MMASVLGEGEQAVKWKDAMLRGIPLNAWASRRITPASSLFSRPTTRDFITGQTFSVAGGMNMI